MSLYPCIECGNEVRPRQQALQCDDCGFWQHRICGTGIDQATYRLAAIRGRMDWLCVACSLAASNPSDQVPVAESTRTDFDQGKEILSPLFVPEIIFFWNRFELKMISAQHSSNISVKKDIFLEQVLSTIILFLQIFLHLLLISTSQRIICQVSKKMLLP